MRRAGGTARSLGSLWRRWRRRRAAQAAAFLRAGTLISPGRGCLWGGTERPTPALGCASSALGAGLLRTLRSRGPPHACGCVSRARCFSAGKLDGSGTRKHGRALDCGAQCALAFHRGGPPSCTCAPQNEAAPIRTKEGRPMHAAFSPTAHGPTNHTSTALARCSHAHHALPSPPPPRPPTRDAAARRPNPA